MRSKKTVLSLTTAAVIASALIAAPIAGAAENPANPLHPAYFVTKAKDTAWTGTNARVERYQDVGNPLSPAFARNGDATAVADTLLAAQAIYTDSNNPLYPGYQF